MIDKPTPSPSTEKRKIIKISNDAPTAPNTDPSKNSRAARIADYRREALARQNLLAAVTGAALADLLEMDHLLHGLIVDALRNGVASFADYHQLDPAIKRRIEVSRQGERMAQLALKLLPPPAAKGTPPQSSSNDTTQRKTS